MSLELALKNYWIRRLIYFLRMVDFEVQLHGGAIAPSPGGDAQGSFLEQVSNTPG